MIVFGVGLAAGIGLFFLLSGLLLKDGEIRKFWQLRTLFGVALGLVLAKLSPIWTRWDAVFDNPFLLWFMNVGLAGWFGGFFAFAGIAFISAVQIRKERGIRLRFRLWGPLFAGVLLFGGALWGLPILFPLPAANPLSAEELLVPDLEGKQQALSDWRGHRVAVNFWATWNSPSLAELAEWKAFAAQKPRGMEVIGVDVLNSETGGLKAVTAFVKVHKVDWRQWTDPEGVLQKGFSIQTLPTTIILDAQGNVAARHDGPIDRFWLKMHSR